MSGIVGMISQDDVLSEIVGAVTAQNFAGQANCLLAICDDWQIKVCSGQGVALQVFSSLEPRRFRGRVGIGYNGDTEDGFMPPVIQIGHRQVVVAIDAAPPVCDRIIGLMDGQTDLSTTLKTVMRKVTEPFALVAVYDSGIAGARNSGLKPLCYGELWIKQGRQRRAHGFYLASQSGAVNHHSKFVSSVAPGEMIIIQDNNRWIEQVLLRPNCERCLQQILFIQRPGNICGRKEVSLIRQAIGRQMARKFIVNVLKEKSKKGWVAISIPSGGDSYVLGFTKESGICFDRGIIKNHYPIPRIEPLESMPVPLNLAVVEEVMKGKRVVVIDDMIRSGKKMALLAMRLRQAGAKEVHGVVAAKTYSSCPYGTGAYVFTGIVKSREAGDLGLDSFTYLTPQELLSAIDIPYQSYCHECLLPA